jgi:hypothetical protein
VIVDTGSHFTAFPCTGCATCGNHYTDPYYNPAKSSTVKTCETNRKNADANEHTFFSPFSCNISQSYTEGSSWRAKKTMDKVKVGPKRFNGEPNTVDGHHFTDFELDFIFGCQTSETGLFRTQLANGIMGMSNSEDTFVVRMKNERIIPKRIFSMCFAEGELKKDPPGNGGTMVLGGFDKRIHNSPVQWVPMASTQSSWFAVEVVDIKVAGVSLGVSSSVYQEGKGMIVDSGTTDTYLPSKIATAFKTQWEGASGYKYMNSKMQIDNRNELPIIEIVLTNGVTLSIPPTQYIEKDGNGFTPRVYLNEHSGGVLGANAMQNFDVIFDAEEEMIGWARSDCRYNHLLNVSQEEEKNVISTDTKKAIAREQYTGMQDSQLSNFPDQTAGILLAAVLLVAFIFLFLFFYLLYSSRMADRQLDTSAHRSQSKQLSLNDLPVHEGESLNSGVTADLLLPISSSAHGFSAAGLRSFERQIELAELEGYSQEERADDLSFAVSCSLSNHKKGHNRMENPSAEPACANHADAIHAEFDASISSAPAYEDVGEYLGAVVSVVEGHSTITRSLVDDLRSVTCLPQKRAFSVWRMLSTLKSSCFQRYLFVGCYQICTRLASFPAQNTLRQRTAYCLGERFI